MMLTAKNTILFLCISAMAAMLCGCEYCSTGYWEAKASSDKLNNLRTGMNKEQVVKVMGEPLKNQVYNKPDIWYYYTQIKWSDSIVSRDECTPLFFKGGILVGWGEQYYKDKVEFRDPKEEDGEEAKAGTDNGSSNLIKAFEQQLEGKIEKKLEGKSEKEIIEYMEKSAAKEMDKTKTTPPPQKKQKAPVTHSVPAPAPVKIPEKTSVAPSEPAPAPAGKKDEKNSTQMTDEKSAPATSDTMDDGTDSRSVKEILEAAEKDAKNNETPSSKK